MAELPPEDLHLPFHWRQTKISEADLLSAEQIASVRIRELQIVDGGIITMGRDWKVLIWLAHACAVVNWYASWLPHGSHFPPRVHVTASAVPSRLASKIGAKFNEQKKVGAVVAAGRKPGRAQENRRERRRRAREAASMSASEVEPPMSHGRRNKQ